MYLIVSTTQVKDPTVYPPGCGSQLAPQRCLVGIATSQSKFKQLIVDDYKLTLTANNLKTQNVPLIEETDIRFSMNSQTMVWEVIEASPNEVLNFTI